LVKGEDSIPRGGVGTERSIIANGVFGSGGHTSGCAQTDDDIFHNIVMGRQFVRCPERG
jgi:hypothetical protein